MTAVIADTDILSTFGKVGRMDLLLRLFGKIYIAPAVYRELLRVEQAGFPWAASVKQAVDILSLTVGEIRDTERLPSLYPQLGSGEVESFALAQTHRLVCLTNDRQAKAVGKTLNLCYLDLEEILGALKTRQLLTAEALAELIDQIEGKDYTRIRAKEDILRD